MLLDYLRTKDRPTDASQSCAETLPPVSSKNIAELSSVGVKNTSIILMAGYAVFALHHLFFLPPPHNFQMFIIAGLTSAFLLALFVCNQIFVLPKSATNPLLILIAVIALGNVVTQSILLAEERSLTNFILIVTGASLIFFSWRMLIAFYALILSSFIWTLQFIQPAPDYQHQYFLLGCSFFIGFLALTIRMNALRHILSSRAQEQFRSDRLAEALCASQRGIEAQQANHSKSNFLAHMSHELRTPLTAIIGFSDIIRRKMFGPLKNDRYAEYIEDIYSSSEHLLSLVNDILDLSKLEENMVEVNFTVMSLDEALQRCASMVREKAQHSEVGLRYIKLAKDNDIYCDPLRLKQIVLNLLSNAVKFTPHSGTVTLEASFNAEGNLTIDVRDTGVGMSEDEIRNAMEPFWQAKAYRASPAEGTGLGLALSKELAILLGGHLEIESQPKVGTSVRLSLPRAAIAIPIEVVAGQLANDYSKTEDLQRG
ncbi:MAG: HAMP domain-containing histidine kinase [Parvibaculaceae bacterium]|nr:HAMP domain-containing histidine kinase [Parvibaculaceae bacterium]